MDIEGFEARDVHLVIADYISGRYFGITANIEYWFLENSRILRISQHLEHLKVSRPVSFQFYKFSGQWAGRSEATLPGNGIRCIGRTAVQKMNKDGAKKSPHTCERNKKC